MNTYPSTYTKKISREIRETPKEYLPALLAMVRLFRESVTLKPADESFLQGWKEALKNEVLPIESLWEGIDAR
jgi:hypothetical protein